MPFGATDGHGLSLYSSRAGEKSALERKLLKANSETEAWRQKASTSMHTLRSSRADVGACALVLCFVCSQASSLEIELMAAAKIKDEAVVSASHAERKCHEATAALGGAQEAASLATEGKLLAEVRALIGVAEIGNAELETEEGRALIKVMARAPDTWCSPCFATDTETDDARRLL